MARPENQARAQRLAELEREIVFQEGENRDAEKQCARLEEQIKSAGDAILRRKQDLTDAVIDEQDLERYFLEELELGFFPGLNREMGPWRMRPAGSQQDPSLRPGTDPNGNGRGHHRKLPAVPGRPFQLSPGDQTHL